MTPAAFASKDRAKLETAYRAAKDRLADHTVKGVLGQGAGYGSGVHVQPLNGVVFDSFMREGDTYTRIADKLAKHADATVVGSNTWPSSRRPRRSSFPRAQRSSPRTTGRRGPGACRAWAAPRRAGGST